MGINKKIVPFLFTGLGVLILGITSILTSIFNDVGTAVDPENNIITWVFMGTMAAICIIIGLFKTNKYIKANILNKKAFLYQIVFCVVGFFVSKILTIIVLIAVLLILLKFAYDTDPYIIVRRYLEKLLGPCVDSEIVDAVEKEWEKGKIHILNTDDEE